MYETYQRTNCSDWKAGDKSTLGHTRILFRLYFMCVCVCERGVCGRICMPTYLLRACCRCMFLLLLFRVLVLCCVHARDEPNSSLFPIWNFISFFPPKIVIWCVCCSSSSSMWVWNGKCVQLYSWTATATELKIDAHKFRKMSGIYADIKCESNSNRDRYLFKCIVFLHRLIRASTSEMFTMSARRTKQNGN